ncbi:putative formamidase [Helianthus debilis subsp. tardiflorus]
MPAADATYNYNASFFFTNSGTNDENKGDAGDPSSCKKDIRSKANKLPVGPRVVRILDLPRCTYDENLPITKNPNAIGS